MQHRKTPDQFATVLNIKLSQILKCHDLEACRTFNMEVQESSNSEPLSFERPHEILNLI